MDEVVSRHERLDRPLSEFFRFVQLSRIGTGYCRRHLRGSLGLTYLRYLINLPRRSRILLFNCGITVSQRGPCWRIDCGGLCSKIWTGEPTARPDPNGERDAGDGRRDCTDLCAIRLYEEPERNRDRHLLDVSAGTRQIAKS